MLTTRYILDEAHLKHYDDRLKSWASSQPVKTLPSSLYPWTQTDKAGAVTCWPVGGAELKPTVDFMFTETGPASGDKGPDNPSTISGVSSVKVTRCGKNLCPLVGESSSSYISVSFTDNGEFIFNGSYIGLANVYVFNATYNTNLFPDYLEQGKAYTFSLQGDNSSVGFEVYKLLSGTNYGSAVVSIAPGESQTYTIPNTQSMILRFKIPANTVLNNAKFKLQIEEGSSATEFEPYAGTDYTLPLGSTYYGGEIDLATGLMTVTHAMYDIGASMTNYSESNEVFYFDAPKTVLSTLPTCESFVYHATTGVLADLSDGQFMPHVAPDPTTQTRWIFRASSYSSVPDFQAAFSGKKLVYQLATPYTVQLSPTSISALAQTDKYTPRLNTLYTDASSIQVGYVKSPIREEYELTQAIVAQGGNI